MSRTLFWYVFKDLLRIFLLASAALAGIMSFGGLLRPLTEHGLDASQVTRILGYFMPAMQTYSLPVAALFATTMVYGRLSADNEMTACRAAGIGYWGIWLPALVLGLLVATVSLVFLCFIVPVFTLKVEKVIYSNLAQLVANEIERDHHVTLAGGDDNQTIFAQQAFVQPSPPDRPQDQVVQLVGPLFVRYEKLKTPNPDRRPPPPEDFFTATWATAFITQDEKTGEVRMQAKLVDGMKFPRRFEESLTHQKPMQLSMERGTFVSDPIGSPVRENVKFMPIHDINHLLEHPDESRRIRTIVADFVREEQQQTFLNDVIAALNSPKGAQIAAGGEETYLLTRGSAPVEIRGDRLYIGPTTRPTDAPPRLRQLRTGHEGESLTSLDATAQQIRLRCWPDATAHTLSVEADLIDAVAHFPDGDTSRSNFARDFVTPMPANLATIERVHSASYYADPRNSQADPEARNRLKREVLKLDNSCISEIHARVSFALSCLVLVMVGCALGMMFKSGNFLTSFALSVVPALMSIVLVVTGQHICQNVPYPIPHNFNNPLTLGVWMIWSGNVAVLIMAIGLLWRLSRQ